MADEPVRGPCFLFLSALPCLIAALVLGPVASHGATFPVSDVAGFQAALTAARDNGQDDTVTVAAGTYDVTSTLTYDSIENFSLTITGAGMASTVLDGGNPPGAHQVLYLRAFGSGASLSIQGMTLRDGLSETETGGALHMETDSGSVTIADCEITDSSVTGTDDATIGGGAAATAVSGQVTVSGCFFRRNASNGNVGGLFASSGSVIEVSNCVFADNSVVNGGASDYWGDGGGAMLYGAGDDPGQEIRVTGCTFARNTAGGGTNPDGGGLMIYQNGPSALAEVTRSSFTDNQAGLGGAGMFIRLNTGGIITCTDNRFAANIGGNGALGYGGGAHFHQTAGDIVITGNTFAANQTAGEGGGIWVSVVDGEATITGNSFTDNTAVGNGGGLLAFTEAIGSTTTVEDNIFDGNIAGGVGGGLSYSTGNGDLRLSSSTFFGNQAAGGGAIYIYSEASAAPAPQISDLVLWNDSPDELDFSGVGTSSLTVRYSDIDGGAGQPWFGSGAIDTDPMFEDAVAGDLRLSWDNYPVDDASKSPCIDSGDPSSPLDHDGSRADMGGLPFGEIFFDGFESGDTGAWAAQSP